MFRRFSLIALALAASLSAGGAHAGLATIFNSTTDSTTGPGGTNIHPEFLQANPIGASFLSPNYTTGTETLTLGLNCGPVYNKTQQACSSSSLGFVTVGLYSNTTAGGGSPSPNFPASTALKSFTVSDAKLYALNSGVASGTELFNFADPFGNYQLAPNTTYWIELTGSASPNTNVSWQFVDANSSAAGNGTIEGTGVSGNEWFTTNYQGGCTKQPCSFPNGGPAGTLHPAALDMSITVPEPASMALLGGALAGLGLIRRRPRQQRRS